MTAEADSESRLDFNWPTTTTTTKYLCKLSLYKKAREGRSRKSPGGAKKDFKGNVFVKIYMMFNCFSL